MREYQQLIPYMVDPNISAEEILQFRWARINPCSAEFILKSEKLAEELREYKGRIKTNRRNGIEARIEIGDMEGFIRENYSYLDSGTQFISIPISGNRRVNTPGAPFAGPMPGYNEHQIPEDTDLE